MLERFDDFVVDTCDVVYRGLRRADGTGDRASCNDYSNNSDNIGDDHPSSHHCAGADCGMGKSLRSE